MPRKGCSFSSMIYAASIRLSIRTWRAPGAQLPIWMVISDLGFSRCKRRTAFRVNCLTRTPRVFLQPRGFVVRVCSTPL